MNKRRSLPFRCCLSLIWAFLIFSCSSLPLMPGRVESLDSSPRWEEIRESSRVKCGELLVTADFPAEEIREQGQQILNQMCSLQNRKNLESDSPADLTGSLILNAEIRERSFMKDLRMKRSTYIVLSLSHRDGENIARYICSIEGRQTIESASRLYKLLDRGFGKLFP